MIGVHHLPVVFAGLGEECSQIGVIEQNTEEPIVKTGVGDTRNY